MKLMRYKLISPLIGQYLGRHMQGEGEHFEWYVTYDSTPESIGMVSARDDTEGDTFIKEIFNRGGDLVLIPNPSNPILIREDINRSERTRLTENKNPKQLLSLTEGLSSGALKYAFCTSPTSDGKKPNVLTFSSTPPENKFYQRIGPIIVRVLKT